jgi:hypothetical protein
MERHMCLSGGAPDRRRGDSGGGGTERARKPTSKSSNVSCQVVTCIHPAGLAGVMLSSGRTHFCRCLATGHGIFAPSPLNCRDMHRSPDINLATCVFNFVSAAHRTPQPLPSFR